MKKILAAVAMLMGLGVSANAMDINGKLELGLGLYDGIPVSSTFKDAAHSAMGWTMFADYKVMDNVAVGLEYGNSFGYEIKGRSTDKTESYLGLRAKYLYPLEIASMKTNVYGILGIANYWHDLDPSVAGVNDDNGLGLSFGLGMNVDVMENIFAGIEARCHFPSEWDGGNAGKLTTNHLNIGLQAGYRF